MATYEPIEQMAFFAKYVEVGNRVWQLVEHWKPLARDTVGKQLIRAADSVGANLVEGDGRYSDADALHFFIMARASARETRYWLQCASDRYLIEADEVASLLTTLEEATRALNRLIRYRRETKNQNMIREEITDYTTEEAVAVKSSPIET